MTDEMKAAFTRNLIALPKMMSARFMALCGVLAYVWLQLSPEQQQMLVNHLPVPAWALPIVATVVGILVRVWPQESLIVASTPAAPAETLAPEPAESEVPAAPEPLQRDDSDALDQALRLIYGDRMSEREIERIKATTALVRNQAPKV